MTEINSSPNSIENIEVDTDSASLDDWESISSETTSLTPSIAAHVYENGRTYHAYRAGTYVRRATKPNHFTSNGSDPPERSPRARLDLLHHIYRLCLGGDLCQAQLQHPQKILDIGTGTGIWAISMADEFPSAEVIGVDLSPIQPTWVPPNVRFIIDDVNQEWSFPACSFDFIHVRSLAGCIDDWKEFLVQCYRHLKPGGQLEISENRHRSNAKAEYGVFPEDSYFITWQREFNRLSEVQGRNWHMMPELPSLLQETSFEVLNNTCFICPVGTWPKDPKLKEIGRCMRAQLCDGALESYTLAMFTRYGNWKRAEVEVLLAGVRSEIKTNKKPLYTKAQFITARKPAS